MNKSRVSFFMANLLDNRPLCFLSALGGFRDLAIGIAFLIQADHIIVTSLYKNYDELYPGVSGYIAGGLLAVLGIAAMMLALTNISKWTRVVLRTQALVWLFSGIMYAIDGAWVIAIALGMFFSVMSGYLAYYYKHAPMWRAKERRFRDDWISQHDPHADTTGG